MHIYPIFGLRCYRPGMAKNDPIVERPTGGSWRTSGNAPDGLRRHLYQQMLRDELGRDPDSRPQKVKQPSLLASSIVIAIIALLTFLAVLGGLLWRDGVINNGFALAQQAEPSRSWMLGDKAQGATKSAGPEAPLESFVETDPAPIPEATPEPDALQREDGS